MFSLKRKSKRWLKMIGKKIIVELQISSEMTNEQIDKTLSNLILTKNSQIITGKWKRIR